MQRDLIIGLMASSKPLQTGLFGIHWTAGSAEALFLVLAFVVVGGLAWLARS